MKSTVTSTLFLLAQASTCFFIMSLAPGTQWSHKPIESLPAAPAVRICTSGRAVAAAVNFNAPRRVIGCDFVMVYPLPAPPVIPRPSFLFRTYMGIIQGQRMRFSRWLWFSNGDPLSSLRSGIDERAQVIMRRPCHPVLLSYGSKTVVCDTWRGRGC